MAALYLWTVPFQLSHALSLWYLVGHLKIEILDARLFKLFILDFIRNFVLFCSSSTIAGYIRFYLKIYAWNDAKLYLWNELIKEEYPCNDFLNCFFNNLNENRTFFILSTEIRSYVGFQKVVSVLLRKRFFIYTTDSLYELKNSLEIFTWHTSFTFRFEQIVVYETKASDGLFLVGTHGCIINHISVGSTKLVDRFLWVLQWI